MLAAVATAAALLPAPSAVGEQAGPTTPGTRPVMFVGNNWEGTATVVDARTFRPVMEIDVIPDREERMAEIASSPDKLAFFLGIRMFVGEGNDQYVDDMFSNPEGTEVYVSRPSFADVVGISLEVEKRWDVGEKLEEFGREDMSAAVRPMAPAPDGRTLYFQVSFHHGFVEFDLEEERVLRVADLPVSEEAEQTPREEYLLDSAHHGLAINPEGTKLCAAGTMSDYAAIVDRDTFAANLVSRGEKPYWATNGHDGRHCWVSYSGDDEVVVIDYATEREIARVPVGDHPQRVRPGVVSETLLAG